MTIRCAYRLSNNSKRRKDMKGKTTRDIEISQFEKKENLVGWLVVESYLDGLEEVASELFNDPEYKKRFNALRRYCNKQLYGDSKCDSTEIEVIIYKEKQRGRA